MKKLYIVLIIGLIALTGCEKKTTGGIQNIFHEDYDKLPENAYININEEIVLFTEPDIKTVVDTNVELKDAKLYTEETGEQVQIIDYTFEGKDHKYRLKYEVVDKIAPIFLSASSYRTILVHDDTNPCDAINIADNYDPIPTCEIIGDYNYEKIGTYNVKYQIKDEAGNINEQPLTISVVKELPKGNGGGNNNTYNPGVQFSWVKNNFKQSNAEFGIDISRWQGDLTVENFNSIKDAGATFVMMRLGVSNKPEEELAVDSKYRNNIKNAKEAGLKVGVYVYTAAINDDMAKTLAKFINDTLDGEQLDFPVVFDWENWSKFRSYQISIHDLNNTFVTFSNEMRNYGYDTMVYGSKHYLEIMWEDRIKNNYPVWLAHYTNSKTSYEGKYMMWQMCSDGHIPGINGEVDIDILYK